MPHTVPLDTTPPVAVLELLSPAARGVPLKLSASRSTDNVGIAHYRWTLEDEQKVVTTDIPEFTVNYAGGGSHVVQLNAIDAAGNPSDAACLVITTSYDISQNSSLPGGTASQPATPGAASAPVAPTPWPAPPAVVVMKNVAKPSAAAFRPKLLRQLGPQPGGQYPGRRLSRRTLHHQQQRSGDGRPDSTGAGPEIPRRYLPRHQHRQLSG
ncbi:MAG: PKD domain-containing protein [Asticcacaulis sp.]